jgi:hypothetical protein
MITILGSYIVHDSGLRCSRVFHPSQKSVDRGRLIPAHVNTVAPNQMFDKTCHILYKL